MNKTEKTLIVVAGPTAVGKTKLAIKLATYFEAEIISADSRQFYKEISIGTAKPSYEELNLIQHHFINNLSIQDESYSAGKFEKDALNTLNNLFIEHDYVIMVGGSGLFIKAVCEGLDNIQQVNLELRERLNQRFIENGLNDLTKELKELDPKYYENADLNNPQRVIRALEVCLSSGKPYSSFRKNTKKERNFKCIKIGLKIEREQLYQQIDKRVDLMIQNGLLDEVRSLMPFKELKALQTVGYSEIFDFFDNKIIIDEALRLVKRNSRRYAKRQMTWFNADEEMNWFDPENYLQILDFIKNSA